MNRKGFTLIELVMVLVLLGIIAVFVAPRLPNITSTRASSFADKLRADIRYAQNLAMTRGQRHRVYFNIAPALNPGYAVQNVTTGLIVPDPAGSGNLSVDLSIGDYSGITITPPVVNPIEFNSLGRPTGGAASLTVNPSGDVINIAAETGAVN